MSKRVIGSGLLGAALVLGACREQANTKSSAPDVSTGPQALDTQTIMLPVPTAAPTMSATPIALRKPKKHRAAAETCSAVRAPITPTASSRGHAVCEKDADCKDGTNGRCGQDGRRWGCTYDDCRSDKDCENGGVCACREAETRPNRCKTGNCRVDADCKGTFCSPSLGNCGHMFGTVGYFCHTVKDECIDDDDCPDKLPDSCRYIPEAGAFKCSHGECKG